MRPVHPGEIPRDELDEAGLSANALSKALGVPANRVTAILNGRRGVRAKHGAAAGAVLRDDDAQCGRVPDSRWLPVRDLGGRVRPEAAAQGDARVMGTGLCAARSGCSGVSLARTLQISGGKALQGVFGTRISRSPFSKAGASSRTSRCWGTAESKRNSSAYQTSFRRTPSIGSSASIWRCGGTSSRTAVPSKPMMTKRWRSRCSSSSAPI